MNNQDDYETQNRLSIASAIAERKYLNQADHALLYQNSSYPHDDKKLSEIANRSRAFHTKIFQEKPSLKSV